MAKAFITGANGFLATNVIIELLANNYSVVGLLRNIKRFAYKTHPNLKLVEGDIANPLSYEDHLKDCDFVIHIAAITAQDLPRYHKYKKINVDATEDLIKLSAKYGLKKFIYVSSANTLGFGSKNNPGNEKTLIKYPFTKSYYALSKLEAEKIVVSYKKKIDVVIAIPTFMLGQYDSKPSSGQIIFMGYKKKIIFYPPGGKNFVHVKDVALGIVLALEKGRSGEVYLLANDNLTYREFFRILSKETGNKPVYIKLPQFLLTFLGLIGSFLRIFKVKTNLSLTNMKAICINNYFDNKKAKEQLGIRFQPTEIAIRDSVDWFSSENMLT